MVVPVPRASKAIRSWLPPVALRSRCQGAHWGLWKGGRASGNSLHIMTCPCGKSALCLGARPPKVEQDAPE